MNKKLGEDLPRGIESRPGRALDSPFMAQITKKTLKKGRPRLEVRQEFAEDFARVLPGLREGSMSKGEAAKRLGISHRSLNRYLEQESVIGASDLLEGDREQGNGLFRSSLQSMSRLTSLVRKRIIGRLGDSGP